VAIVDDDPVSSPADSLSNAGDAIPDHSVTSIAIEYTVPPPPDGVAVTVVASEPAATR
jgi:hypothetical protein